MARICSVDGCNNPVWGTDRITRLGYCKFHQGCRSDWNKKIGKPKEPTGEKELFMEIWKERPRISFLSGKPLDCYYETPFFPNIFAHVLSKAQNKYPKFKLNKENILLLTPQEHLLLDMGTEENREAYAKENNCSWDKIYKLKDELLNEYKELYG